MKPLGKIELREARQKFKSEKVRSLSPLFEQIIEIARSMLFFGSLLICAAIQSTKTHQ